MDAREANDRIAEKAEWLHFVSRVPMLCECSARGCRTVVMVSLDDYRAIRGTEGAVLTASGHSADGTRLEEETTAYDVRRDDVEDERRSA